MSTKINDLVEPFREPVAQLLANCEARGIRMVPTETLRTPWQQAIYWRQSRSIVEIRAAVAQLRAEGAPFLAEVIEAVGPRNGDEVTRALPGNSWHQWGEAIDCFWEVDGKAEWSTVKKVNGLNGYSVYADEAAKLGLDAGLKWSSFKDAPHVQMRSVANPKSSGLTWAQIDATMRERFASGDTLLRASVSLDAATASPEPLSLSYVGPGGWRVFETTDVQSIVFRAKMAIDADGAPKAYHSNNAVALDYLANAGRPGNWWALVTNANGVPRVQDARDPAQGYFVSKTALVYDDTDPARPEHYVDAAKVPFFVLPGGRYKSFSKDTPIRLGDVGVAYNLKTKKMSYAIFADIGPGDKIGEGSIALANALGINGDPKSGGVEDRQVLYLVFQGSGRGSAMTLAELNATAKPLFDRWGGVARMEAYGGI
ncbi:glycoside hydrolase family 75 protein [Xanthobacter sp. 126]|uniref:glycoside hydrolase family 75 protein n=1 Tax=Xanthobacter sp. 126 TaxID=1131814 RepID=UPI00045E5ABB|nr:glycoside hydrolase family 75 protein [Xanthobacter sp. 126]